MRVSIALLAAFCAALGLAASAGAAPAVSAHTSEEIALIDSNSHVIGTPSAPDPDADGFNACTWTTSCAAPSGS